MRPRSRPTLPLLLLVVAPLLAGLLAAFLLWGGVATVYDYYPSARRDGDAAGAGAGAGLDAPGMALDSSAAPRPRAPSEPGAPDEDGPPPTTFPPSEGVTGRVLTAGGTPIAGAKVTLHVVPTATPYGAPDPPATAETLTAKDGTFLVGPAPLGRLKVRATAKGFAPSVLPVPRRGARIEITLDVGGSLRVKVVGADGAAVPEATVLHQAGHWGLVLVSEGATDATGVAFLESVPSGTGSLLVTKAGRGAARRHEVSVSPGRTTEAVLVLQGGQPLTGTVTNALDKRPVSGASIEVHYPGLPGLQAGAPAVSDEDGRYRATVDVSVGEQFELRVTRAGFADLRLWLNYNDGGAGSMTHDLVLDQAVPGFGGRVRGQDGGAVIGAEISYGGQQPGQVLPSTTSGAEGRFELPAPAWGGPATQWWIVALHPTEGVGSGYATLPQRNATRGTEVEIVLSGSGRVSGTVRDASGAALAGAAVALLPDGSALGRRPNRQGSNSDWLTYQLLSDGRVAGALAAVSDAEGRFVIESVPAATYLATAVWGALQGRHEGPLEVSRGQEAKASIELGVGQSIEGLTLDAEGRPVPGATIWSQAQGIGGATPRAHANARSQSDGRFKLLNVAAGSHTLFAHASGFAQAQQGSVASGTRDVQLRLKALGWIEGQVLLDERPYAGTFHVTASSAGEQGDLKSSRLRESDQEHSQTFNDAEGRFVLQGLAGREFRLTASTGDGLILVDAVVVQVVEGVGTGPVLLKLSRGASLSGEVETADGRPLTGAWVWASPLAAEGRGPGAGARSDKVGAFRIRGLGTGTYRLGVSAEEGASWTDQVDLLLGTEQRVRLREKLPGRVRVTVMDPNQGPVARARPTLHDLASLEVHANWKQLRREGLIDGRTQESWESATLTDSAGRLTRHHVPPGRYRVGALLEGWLAAAEPGWIDVVSGGVTDVTVVLKRAP